MSSAKNSSSCCTPVAHRTPQSTAEPIADASQCVEKPTVDSEALDLLVLQIPGGDALKGTDQPMIPMDEESPCRRKKIEPFRMMQSAVTNALFESFVTATGYITEAERYGWSFVFQNEDSTDAKPLESVAAAPWWRKTSGATWRNINGPDAEANFVANHPVVHVSWNDAIAFAKWAGGRLPSESEWEHAARGGLGDVPFPWGTREPNDTDFQPCNVWQGRFPEQNLLTDGYASTAPAKSFEPNGYGLHNMCGNVWEWTSGRYKIESRTKEGRRHAKNTKGFKLLKGGSFLCHKSYCFRYRIAARSGTTPDSTTAHQGFRLVF